MSDVDDDDDVPAIVSKMEYERRLVSTPTAYGEVAVPDSEVDAINASVCERAVWCECPVCDLRKNSTEKESAHIAWQEAQK